MSKFPGIQVSVFNKRRQRPSLLLVGLFLAVVLLAWTSYELYYGLSSCLREVNIVTDQVEHDL